MQEPTKKADHVSSGAAKIALGVIGTVVLGAIGSGLWEILFRPGLGRVSNFITSASTMAEHSVYTTAALDPTPVPDLLLLLFLVQIPALIAMWFLSRGYLEPFLSEKIRRRIRRYEAESADDPDKDQIVRGKVRRNIKLIATFGAIYSLFFFALFLYAFTIENKAVVVWRVFHQNLEIIAPHLRQSEVLRLRSSFRSMQSRDDFERIQKSLDAVATAHSVNLNWRDAR